MTLYDPSKLVLFNCVFVLWLIVFQKCKELTGWLIKSNEIQMIDG